MGTTVEAGITPGILPSALRASLQLFKIAPGNLVKKDILICEHCGSAVKVAASIEEPVVIEKIHAHLSRRAEAATPFFSPFTRAPSHQQLPSPEEPG